MKRGKIRSQKDEILTGNTKEADLGCRSQWK